ncbi:MAG: accessory factor UbiK family protein [Gammaproteobacteria bacterium]|nr:accessory factor UbiK family protein [Gammaproteobacteria bacterium]MCP4475938.1 accessory factor UbiK family protein [Gammaproteobacteria bacterium]
MSSNIIEEITNKVMQQLPQGAQKVKSSIEKSLRVVLEELFAKMDLVTREEFDAQTKVLTRAQQQLDALQKKLEQLEQTDK